jgi:hypothetical protein
MNTEQSIIALLTSRFNDEIIAYLTTTDHDDEDVEENLGHSVSKSVALDFINSHKDSILEAVNTMIRAYKNDDELDDLNNPEADWIREYLYDTELHTAMDVLRGVEDEKDE